MSHNRSGRSLSHWRSANVRQTVSVTQMAQNCMCAFGRTGLLEVSLTNNGAVPKERSQRAEAFPCCVNDDRRSRRQMEVWSIPRFKLMLSLPEQEEAAYE